MTFYVTNIEADEKATVSVSPLQAQAGVYRNFVKPVFETALVLLFSPIIVVFIAIMALLVASGGGNPFYSQMRVGKGGRHFRLWKLRTMVPNAEAILESHLEQNPVAREEWDRTQKLKVDPRITRVGRILRKTSMDELPQLWNVLMGSMSLVGPRPMMVKQKAEYHGRAYYHLRPGITGFWQVKDRNSTAFTARVKHDEDYNREISFATDVKTLVQTVGVVLRGTGY